MFNGQRIRERVRWMMNTYTDKEQKMMDILLRLAKLAHEAEATGEHSHKCNKCGHIWSHEDSCLNDVKNHTCKCGTEQWWVFHDKREGQWQSCATLSTLNKEGGE